MSVQWRAEHVDPGEKGRNRGLSSPRRTKWLTWADLARWSVCAAIAGGLLAWLAALTIWGGA